MSPGGEAAEAAALLLEARRTGRPLERLPERLRPADIAGAYAIQAQVHAALGRSGAWKVSGGPPAAASPVAVLARAEAGEAPPPGAEGIEGEIALRLGADLVPDPAMTVEALASLIDAHAPAFELTRARVSHPDQTRPEKMADDFIAHAVVLGAPVAGPPAAGAFPRPVLLRDGVDAQAPYAPIDPLASLLAFARVGGDPFGGMKAGDWIITGSLTGLPPVRAGQVWRLEAEGLAPLEAVIA
ncbi:2-keto-4-pentenoate hydratase [Albimonas donghaensis]|uniref:2-keto-4-pentenoate hydratase n=1 Tax=Albimonas donghaensis TaxID=356660 RepID=A0A1H3FE83_9RHOB|nr:hypothetical protein [Albimonas donghaensis]SDX89322.1 2-keto-4-pentenoate hydratase [Albimonas donghaensis]